MPPYPLKNDGWKTGFPVEMVFVSGDICPFSCWGGERYAVAVMKSISWEGGSPSSERVGGLGDGL